MFVLGTATQRGDKLLPPTITTADCAVTCPVGAQTSVQSLKMQPSTIYGNIKVRLSSEL